MSKSHRNNRISRNNAKQRQLSVFKTNDRNKYMTTNQGLPIANDDVSLKAGTRGPTLMEDFHFREKMTHFDHERMAERVVHARGSAAHGEFTLTKSLALYTKAKIFQEVGKTTPVFTRFSTVVGSRGSFDLARDVRGFATKFYTEEGVFDLVGNNIPVFFIQDGIKFPDLVHAIKPEPHNEVPQASSAHDTFWDFIIANQETAHMVMWLMSDRAIPRSYRMMQGFGVNTFRLVNGEGKGTFVKFHWIPKLGVHSVVWDEAQKINGKHPDFHREDLYEAIEHGEYPVYELGVQLLPEDQEFAFDFDILDATKLWPEEIVPVHRIGKLTLNRNVDNFFAETEQVAFHPGHLVNGIDFTNDPLLQGRLFSYTDTQLNRFKSPNFHEIPINRPLCPFHNNQRDGLMRQTINKGQVAYHKNTLWENTPRPKRVEEGGFQHYSEKIEGRKIQARSKSFSDHFSQATLFWNSMSQIEKQHIIDAFSFELGKVKSKHIRQGVVNMFSHVNRGLAQSIACNIGANPPISSGTNSTASSLALSQMNTNFVADTRTVAVLAANGFSDEEATIVLQSLQKRGLHPVIVSDRLGLLTGKEGRKLEVNQTFETGPAILYDALYILAGNKMSKVFSEATLDYTQEMFRHFKVIATKSDHTYWLQYLDIVNEPGIFVFEEFRDGFMNEFVAGIARHRFWERQLIKESLS